jgi:hypothetical protein
MMNRRIARLTYAFSKKLANHGRAFALLAMHCNSCRIDKTQRVAPALQAGVANCAWSCEEISTLLDNPRHCP